MPTSAPSENLDRDIGRVALEWKNCLSKHRAVADLKRTPQRPPGRREGNQWASLPGRAVGQASEDPIHSRVATGKAGHLGDPAPSAPQEGDQRGCEHIEYENQHKAKSSNVNALAGEVMEYINGIGKANWPYARRTRHGCEQIQVKTQGWANSDGNCPWFLAGPPARPTKKRRRRHRQGARGGDALCGHPPVRGRPQMEAPGVLGTAAVPRQQEWKDWVLLQLLSQACLWSGRAREAGPQYVGPLQV